MSMTRREFIALTATACAGCATVDCSSQAAAPRDEKTVDAGPAAGYPAEGVYPRFRDLGFFVVRRGGHLVALSSWCTHRKCKLTAETDHSFYCGCHGSTFDPFGKVTEGPAKRDLPVLPSSINGNGHLIVKVPPG